MKKFSNYIVNINKEKINDVISFGCILGLGIVLGIQVTKISQSFSIGKLMQSSGPIIFIFILLIMNNYGFKRLFSFANAKAELQPLWILFTVFVGVVFAPMLMWVGSNISITYFIVGYSCLFLFIGSVMLCLKNKVCESLGLMLLVFPFVTFIEYNFQGTFVEKIDLGIITVTPRIVWLICLFFVSFLNAKRTTFSLYVKKYPLILIFLFVSFALLSSFVSKDPLLSINGTFLEIICPFMFFIIILKAIKNIRDIYILIAAIIVYLFLTSLEGMYFYYMHYGSLIGEDYFRNQNFRLFNIYRMAVNSLIAIFLIFVFWNNKFHKYKPIIFGLIAFFSSICFLSQTRVTIFSFAISFFIYALSIIFNKSGTKKLVIIVVSMVCVSAFLYLKSGFHFERVFDMAESRTFFKDINRTTAWHGTIKMIKDYPLFGIGWDMWDRYVASYIPPTVWYFSPYVHKGYILNPHNYYISIAVFFGIPTLFIFLLIIIYLVTKCLQIMYLNKKTVLGELIVSTLAALVCYLFSGTGGEEHFFTAKNTESGLFLDFSKGFIFFLLIGLILKIDALSKIQSTQTQQ